MMRFLSETPVFKFPRRSVTGPLLSVTTIGSLELPLVFFVNSRLLVIASFKCNFI